MRNRMLAVAAVAAAALVGASATAQAADDVATQTTLTASPATIQLGATDRAFGQKTRLTAVVRDVRNGGIVHVSGNEPTYQVLSGGATVAPADGGGEVTFNGTTCQAVVRAIYKGGDPALGGGTYKTSTSDTVMVRIRGGQDCPNGVHVQKPRPTDDGRVTVQPVPCGGASCAATTVPCNGRVDCVTKTVPSCDGRADCETPCDKPECATKTVPPSATPTVTATPTLTVTATAPGSSTVVERTYVVEKAIPVTVYAPATGPRAPAYTG